jgi:hypothetical protein
MVFCPGGRGLEWYHNNFVNRNLTAAPFRLENPASEEVLVWEPLCRSHFTVDGGDDDLLDALVYFRLQL